MTARTAGDPAAPRPLRVPAGALTAGLVTLQLAALAAVVVCVVRATPLEQDTAAVAGVVLVTAVCCAVAAWRARSGGPPERAGRTAAVAAWSLLALALLPLAGVLFERLPDVATAAFAPLAGLALVLLHRRLPRWVPGHRWDAAVVLLGSFSVLSAILLVVPDAGAMPSGLPPPVWLAALACLALAGAALAARRSRPVVWWVAGGFLTVAIGEALHRQGNRTPRFGLPELVTAAGFSLVGVGALRGSVPEPGPGVLAGDRRRQVVTVLPARALAWTCGGAALLVVGLRLAGAPVPVPSALVGWAAIGTLLARGGVTIVRGRSLGDARTDRLTGLASREAISEALASEAPGAPDVEGWIGRTERVSLLLADIDGFDAIN